MNKINVDVDNSKIELSTIQVLDLNHEILRITPDGEIFKNGENITDNDVAVADVLREFISTIYNVKIRPANRNQS